MHPHATASTAGERHGSRSLWTTSLALSCLLITIGCTTTREQTRSYVKEGVESQDRQTEVLLKLAEGLPIAPEAVQSAQTAFGKSRDSSRAEFERIRKEIEEQKKELMAYAHAAAGIALAAVPGGSVAHSAWTVLGNRIGERIDKVAEFTNQISVVSTSVDALKKDSDQLKLTMEGEVKAKLKKLDVSEEQLKTVMASLEAAKTRLATMDESLKLKLASLDAPTVRNLLNLAGDDKAFSGYLKEKANLTDSDLAKFKGMTPTEIIAAIIALLGAAGTAKLGKSRSQPEIEALKREIAALQNGSPRRGTSSQSSSEQRPPSKT